MGLTPRHPETNDVVAWQRETDNGQIPRALLQEIRPPQPDPDLQAPARMYPPAADAMTALLAAARAANHPVRVKYSYRTLAKQKEKWADFQNGGNVAAVPGTSNHGEGLAVDFTDLSSTDVIWLRDHAWEFKFDNGDVSDEPWHWTYRGGYLSPDQEDDMKYEEFKKGVKAANDGDPLPDAPDPDFAFGYRMELRATSEPKPDAPAEHFHRVNVTKRKTGSPLV